jgi:hypothetical protein
MLALGPIQRSTHLPALPSRLPLNFAGLTTP